MAKDKNCLVRSTDIIFLGDILSPRKIDPYFQCVGWQIRKMEFNNSMQVVKRDGHKEDVSFDKVLERIRKAASAPSQLKVNATAIAQRVIDQIYDGVHTTQLDDLACQLAVSLSTLHPDYGILAARIAVSNHQKNTEPSFVKVVKALASQKMPQTGEPLSYVSEELLTLVREHGAEIDARIEHDRDYLFDYFGFKTLEKSYLLRDSAKNILERPQHMWMRVSLALWGSTDLNRAFETYDLMSLKKFTHATPTLFNAGTPRQQLSSCFLMGMADDSISGIYKTLGDCAAISKHAGGIGLHVHNVRARGSIIRGTNGTSNGLVPMLRVFNNTARYVDQCFTPDTLIYTQNGIKRIEDVNTTDKVLTSNGTYENVNMPVRHEYKGKMLKIQVKNAISSIQVTPEHQIFALKGQNKGVNFDVIKNRLNKNIVKPEFEDAKDLLVGDFVVYPIPTYVNNIESITEDDCRLYGIMLGDGHISETTAYVSLHSENKQDTANFVEQYFEKRGVKTIKEEREDLNTRIRWSPNSVGFKFTRSQLYDVNKEKHIDIPMLHLPNNKLIQIIRGLIETDGCVGTKEVSVEMSSDNVIEGLRYMLLRLGCLASGYDRDRIGNVSSYKNITTRKTTKVLRVPRINDIMKYFPDSPTSEYVSYLNHNGYIYSRIETIDEVEYDGVVHDFEIAEPHDYTVAHLGIAHNGGGKRNGSFAIYLEPWHADVEDFLRLKLNTGSEEERARDLFYALWISDLFMERVEADGEWSLFCPNEAPGLADVYGDKFRALYERYEREGRARKIVSAQKLWFQILDTQMETGTPYLLYKDPANQKSNQKNLGTIKSSNLCTEIMEYSSPEEQAVCNLASIGLPAFVRDMPVTHEDSITFPEPQFDFEEFRRVVKIATKNLNRVIDINYYPTPETKRSNMRHRPIGLGVQGLADVFAMLKFPWESCAAATLNQLIFEHLYFAAAEASMETATVEGPYETFAGSPTSEGILQPDMWGMKPITESDGTLDWTGLRAKIAQNGLRNSLLVAPMPTASTSQILGYNECFEPFTTNIYARRTLAGEFPVINKYLLADLISRDLWNEDLKQKLIANNGSVQGIDEIPAALQELYKNTWEIKMRVLIDMAAARGAFICQSQSLNLFVADATYSKLTSMHFYAWKKGLKTGCYYLRTKAPVMAQKFTVDPKLLSQVAPTQQTPSTTVVVVETPEEEKKRKRRELLDRLAKEAEESAKQQCSADNGEGCLLCSS